MKAWQILQGDCLDEMEWMSNASVQCCVTSPPYFGLRDYGHAGQIGLETTPAEYVRKMVDVFREVRRVLKPDGTLWLNLGDSYNNFRSQMGPGQAVHGRGKMNGKPEVLSKRRGSEGFKEKEVLGIPWRVAFALQQDGWYLRQDIIWHKPNPMPESVRDRCTKAHEYIFLFSKSPKYYFDSNAMREPIAPSQEGPVRADPIGGKSHKERGQHSKGGIYATGNRSRDFGPKAQPSSPFTSNPTRLGDQQTRGGILVLEPGREGHLAPIEQGRETRNRRSVWTVATRPYKGAHFATYPPALIAPCVLAGSRVGDMVFDPFAGSGTTGAVAVAHGRKAIMCELNAEYVEMIKARMAQAEEL